MVVRKYLLLIGLLALVGCERDPPTRVQLPITVRPSLAPSVAADGSIYRATNSRPLFEDRRARFVGDTITVNLVEKTSANRKTNESMSRKSSADIGVGLPRALHYPSAAGARTKDALDFNSSSDISTANKQDDGNSNTVSGTMTVTVTDVLPNGNLQVSGEKMVAINQGTEFVRLSGVVNPINISSSNTVNSTQIADAKIESKQKQSVDVTQVMSAMARFFTLMVPF